ncbi:MAG: hypothetical protein Q9195_003292 [Heterodermia aff. obscurata]
MPPSQPSNLPAAVWEVYRSSKQKTEKAVNWLLRNSGELAAGSSQHLPVTTLVRAASSLQWRNIEASEEVCYLFEDAIRARRHMTSYYKSTEASPSNETETHQHFTSVLEAILHSLRPLAPPSSTPPSSTPPPPTTELSERLNQFSILDTIEESSHESTAAAMSRYEASIGDEAVLSRTYVGMENEAIGRTLTMHGLVLVSCDLVVTNVSLTFAQELDILCSKVKDIWEQASTGAIPFIAAAWLTSAAYHVLRQRLRGFYVPLFGEDTQHRDLYELAKQARSLPPFTFPDEIRFPIYHSVFRSMHGMITPMQALEGAMEEVQAEDSKGQKAISNTVADRVKLAEVVIVARRYDDFDRLYEQCATERKWMDSIIKSMRQIEEATEMDITSSLFDANPVMEDILRPPPEEDEADEPLLPRYTKQTPSVFGLVLLVESTKSFMFPEDAPPQTMNCRFKALGLARDMKASVMAINKSRPIIPGSNDNYPICTDDKLAMGLQLLEDDLSAFLGHVRWDFYYQAPWVAGAQMLWMLSQANDYGMVLCNRRRYMGAVLHLYNCLKQLDHIEAEPVLLERLCDLMGQQVFGSVSGPRTDFFRVWARYAGGEREYDPLLHSTSNFYESYSPQEDILPFKPRDRLWRVATHKFKEDKRISLSNLSYFYALESTRYDLNGVEGVTTLARMLHGKEKGGDATDEETAKVRDVLSNQFLALTLENMQPSIVSELEGEFPIAKINWFAVYMTCTGILELIGKYFHASATDQEQKSRMEKDFHVTGVRWIEMFLTTADQGTRHRRARKAWEKKEEAHINAAAAIIRNALVEKKTADFVWKT